LTVGHVHDLIEELLFLIGESNIILFEYTKNDRPTIVDMFLTDVDMIVESLQDRGDGMSIGMFVVYVVNEFHRSFLLFGYLSSFELTSILYHILGQM
jgi:hypothetical protein